MITGASSRHHSVPLYDTNRFYILLNQMVLTIWDIVATINTAVCTITITGTMTDVDT